MKYALGLLLCGMFCNDVNSFIYVDEVSENYSLDEFFFSIENFAHKFTDNDLLFEIIAMLNQNISVDNILIRLALYNIIFDLPSKIKTPGKKAYNTEVGVLFTSYADIEDSPLQLMSGVRVFKAQFSPELWKVSRKMSKLIALFGGISCKVK